MRRALRRLLSSRGATGVEYALVLTFFVVGSIGAIEYLSSEADSETENQAACVETRPPVAGCQLSPVVPSTSTTLPGTPPPVPPPPGSPPTPPDPCTSADPPASCYEPPPPPPTIPSNNATATTPVATTTGTQMHVSQSFTVRTPGGAPVAGAVIEIQIKVKNPAPPPTFFPVAHYPTCTTDAAGNCTIEFDIPEANGTGWEIAVFKITSTPPTNRPTTVWDFNR